MDYLPGMIVDEDWQLIAHESKKKTVQALKDIHARLLIAHKTYKQSISDFDKALSPTSFTEIEKDLLVDYYENSPTNLNKLIQNRRNNHNLNCCPYCGYPNAPDTLDHFIPKDNWPEFSFLPNNLVPQCRGCAPIKGSAYYCTTSAGCYFIHPIFSNLISRVCIRVSITFDQVLKRPNYSVRCTVSEASAADLARVTRHMIQMKIKSRVLNYCEREFGNLRRQLTKRSFDVRDLLKINIGRKMDLGGRPADWECALYQAILNDQASIDYLHSFRPTHVVPTEAGVESELTL